MKNTVFLHFIQKLHMWKMGIKKGNDRLFTFSKYTMKLYKILILQEFDDCIPIVFESYPRFIHKMGIRYRLWKEI